MNFVGAPAKNDRSEDGAKHLHTGADNGIVLAWREIDMMDGRYGAGCGASDRRGGNAEHQATVLRGRSAAGRLNPATVS